MEKKKPGQDGENSCGTSTSFNFIVGTVTLIVTIAAGYIGYTQFLQ